jgi:hypothetical protein
MLEVPLPETSLSSIRSIQLDRNFVMRTQRDPSDGIALRIDLLNAGPVSPLVLVGVRLKDFTDARDCGKSSVRVLEDVDVNLSFT